MTSRPTLVPGADGSAMYRPGILTIALQRDKQHLQRRCDIGALLFVEFADEGSHVVEQALHEAVREPTARRRQADQRTAPVSRIGPPVHQAKPLEPVDPSGHRA